MALKIMGGLLKGLNLHFNDKVTKPTGALLKRKVFDAKQSFDGVYFYDLCAGSGSMGIEALSRGAEKVTMIEANSLAVKFISSTIQLINQRYKNTSIGEVVILKKSISSWLPYFLASTSSNEMIVFFDPPYEDEKLYQEVLSLFESSQFKGELWVEYDLKAKESILVQIERAYEVRGIKKYIHGQRSICLLKFC